MEKDLKKVIYLMNQAYEILECCGSCIVDECVCGTILEVRDKMQRNLGEKCPNQK